MDNIDQRVKRRFVSDVLTEEGKRFIKNQGLAMRKLLQFHTGTTFNDRSAKVKSQDHYDGELSISLRSNVRFLDIRSNKSRRGSKILKLYNRFVYGHYFHIGERLMYELTPDVKHRIKSALLGKHNG